MVSQLPMRRILGLPTCLLGLTAALLLFAACGQNEGGRCQVASDCASGLECRDGQTGNGRCVPQGAVVTQSGPEVGPEVGIDALVTLIDADTPESEAVTLDTGAVDSGSLDSAAID